MAFEWNTTEPTNRLRTALPRVGIRPAIDGRRKGVRESLEQVTMRQAHGVAALVSDNLRHACGLLTGSGPFTDTYSVMDNWGANHCVITCGHVGSDLLTLASILRIPVCMHNVAAPRLFRPKAWSLFGPVADDGADYRACANFGPLYR